MRKFSVNMFVSSIILLLAAVPFASSSKNRFTQAATVTHYLSVNYQNVQWQKIVPELGADSPEIAILRIDPKTQATHLLIRNSRKMHVPSHWHIANETHTILAGTMVFECEGKRDVLGPGSFNFIPARMAHQAWLPDGGLVLITVDSSWDINWVAAPPTSGDIGVDPPRNPAI